MNTVLGYVLIWISGLACGFGFRGVIDRLIHSAEAKVQAEKAALIQAAQQVEKKL